MRETAKFYIEVMNTKRQKEGKFGHAVCIFPLIFSLGDYDLV